MGSLRIHRGNEVQFFRREEIRSNWTTETALNFLGAYRNDAAAISTLRQLMLHGQTGSSAGRLSVDELLQNIARQMVSGQLIVAVPAVRTDVARLNVDPEPAPAPAKPMAKVKDAPEDPPTFEPSHDAAAQAAVLVAAAQSGVPFCEECERQASDRAAA